MCVGITGKVFITVYYTLTVYKFIGIRFWSERSSFFGVVFLEYLPIRKWRLLKDCPGIPNKVRFLIILVKYLVDKVEGKIRGNLCGNL